MDALIKEQLEIFSRYIRNEGLRMTHQREVVITTFLKSEGHLSTDELYALVKEADAKIGYATVSRTLKALIGCGLARRTDLGDGRARFEHLYNHPYHHHIICSECSRAIEFFSPELERLQERILARYDFQPVRSRFQILGVCPDCQGQREPNLKIYPSDQVFARDALKLAMETEERGVRFYEAASECVGSESTKAAFLKMLGDETNHLRRLRERWDSLVKSNRKVLDAPVFLHFDFEALQRIFPSREEVDKKLNSALGETEALKLALAMERDAFEFFKKYADKFNDTKGRDIFEKFAAEELEHCEIIQSALDAISPQ
jgi:Fur family ferric uptake transcriptional regulator